MIKRRGTSAFVGDDEADRDERPAAIVKSFSGSQMEPTGDQHRREIIRFFLALRVLFLIVSLGILLAVPQHVNVSFPADFTTKLWWAWGVFFAWTISLAWVTHDSGERRLIAADRLIAISIFPDCFALYLAASVTGAASGLTYRSIYFLIAFHSYHLSTRRAAQKSAGHAQLLPLAFGAAMAIVCGLAVYVGLVGLHMPVVRYAVEGGLQGITATAFLLVRWSDLRRAQELSASENELAASQEEVRVADNLLKRQIGIEGWLLEAMKDVSTIGRISDGKALDEKLRKLVGAIGENVGSEYCVLGLMHDDRLVVVARYCSFPINDTARPLLKTMTSHPLGDGLIGYVLGQKLPRFCWNSADARDLMDLSDDELKALGISLDREGTRHLVEKVLPSKSLRHLLVAPFYSPDDEQRPLGYLELLNDMPNGELSATGFSESDQERLETIAGQLAVAISNFERHRSDLARADQESFFSSLILTPDLDDLFDRVLSYLNTKYSSRVASLWVATEDGFGTEEEKLRVVLRSVVVAEQPEAPIWKKSLEESLRKSTIFRPDECFVGQFFSTAADLSVTSVDDMRTVTDSWAAHIEQIGTSHLIAIPISRYPSPSVPQMSPSAGPRLAGVVCLRPLRPFLLTAERREELERFADYLTVVIEQVRYRRRYRQIEVLKDQLPALQSANLTDFYQGVVNLVRTALSAEACSLFAGHSDGALILKATTATRAIRGEQDGTYHEFNTNDWIGKVVYPEGSPNITARIADVRKVTLIADVYKNPEASEFFREKTLTPRHGSLIGAPILYTDGTRFGAIRCINRKKTGALLPVFVKEDQEFLGLIMGIMSPFIENVEASESKRDFLRQLAHELATPLAALKSQIDFLEDVAIRGRSVRDSEEQFAYLREQADFIHYLVTDIQYQFGRGAAIKTRFDFAKAVDLKATIERIKKLLLSTARMDKEVDILTGTSRMPPLHVDPRRMEQVIFNLVQNAVKYSRKGQGPIFISYDFVEEPDLNSGHPVSWHRLAFKDSGVGIRTSDLPFIFDEYRRGTNIEGSPSGTGLGLAVAKRIVEAHGGRLMVIHLKNPTVFAVDLPEYLTRRPPSDTNPDH